MDGPMSLSQAFKAPIVTTFADNVGMFAVWVFYCIYAIRSWTPFSLLIDINKRSFEVMEVFLIKIIITNLFI